MCIRDSSILPQKDVDGFHPVNLGCLVQGDSGGLLPCTPSGVMRILEASGVKIEGSRAVVLGRSRIVGMPMALMLAQKGSDATVTIAHSRTAEIESVCSEADILVAAVGSAHMVGAQWVKPGAFVIDVGISRVEGRLAGDVSPEVSEIAGWLTPVPGGVGPMTIAMLMRNTLRAAEWQADSSKIPISNFASSVARTRGSQGGENVRFTWALSIPSVASAALCTAAINSGATGQPGLVRVISTSTCIDSIRTE